MLIYTVQVRKADGSVFCRTCLSKDEGGQTAEQRAVAATIAAAGPGVWVAQNVNLINIDIDLTA